jgi:hypothetical protein
VRVGREALDSEAVRLLEQHNPDVTFDWPRLLKSASAPPLGPPAGNPPPREDRRRDRRDRRGQPVESLPGSGAVPLVGDLTLATDDSDATDFTRATDPADRTDFVPATEPAEDDADFVAATPLTVESDTGDGTDAAPALDAADPSGEAQPAASPPTPEVETDAPPPPVEPRYARLGADGLARLRARYADVRARLEGRSLEDAERAELLAKVERLNPDAWQTEHEVAHALEEYEVVFEALRPLVGRQPRSRRL